MFDAHCHLHFEPSTSTQASLLEHRRLRGVEGLVLADYDATQRPALMQLVRDHHDVYGCLGLHPWSLKALDDEGVEMQLSLLQQALEQHHQEIIAIGESGLDHFVTARHDSPARFKARQKRALEAQCVLALQYDLPLVLHQVKAEQSLYHQMKSHKSLSFMLHAFEGHPQQAEQWLRLRRGHRRVLCSFGPALTWRRGERARQSLRWIAQNAPQCWTLETDAPDRPPDGLTEQDNADAQWLPRVVQAAAQVLEISEADAANIARDNAYAFFGVVR